MRTRLFAVTLGSFGRVLYLVKRPDSANAEDEARQCAARTAGAPPLSELRAYEVVFDSEGVANVNSK